MSSSGRFPARLILSSGARACRTGCRLELAARETVQQKLSLAGLEWQVLDRVLSIGNTALELFSSQQRDGSLREVVATGRTQVRSDHPRVNFSLCTDGTFSPHES